MFFNKRTAAVLALAASSLIIIPGCAVTRDQSTMGEYVDDAAITTKIKAKFVEDKAVAASAIHVETLNGTVMLSGFAKSQNEKDSAAAIARDVKGVKSVKNEIAVRP
jgi:hyperosmotically inducible periplasmic protein